MRGGSHWNNARNCRSAYRNRYPPAERNDNIGFRVLLPRSRGWRTAKDRQAREGPPLAVDPVGRMLPARVRSAHRRASTRVWLVRARARR